MNYLFLKNIIESLLTHFTCAQCGTKIQEQSILLRQVATSHVDLELHCPKCSAKSAMRAEVNKMASSFFSSPQGQDFLQGFARAGKTSEMKVNVSSENDIPGSVRLISDEDILKFEEDLNAKRTIKDLMDEF